MTSPVERVPSEEELNEIQARADAATEAPWHIEQHWDHVLEEQSQIVCGPNPRGVPRQGIAEVFDQSEGDAVFIAAARTDVPRLVEAVRVQRAENERLTEQNRMWRNASKLREQAIDGIEAERDALAAEVERLKGRLVAPPHDHVITCEACSDGECDDCERPAWCQCQRHEPRDKAAVITRVRERATALRKYAELRGDDSEMRRWDRLLALLDSPSTDPKD